MDDRGNLSVVDGQEALRQRLVERFQFRESEWYLDVRRGVPYLRDVFRRPVQTGLIKVVLADEDRKEDDVTAVLGVDVLIEPTTRTATITVRVQTIYGRMEVQANG